MLSFDEARELILADVRALPAETIPVADAPGRVLAESVCAEADLVPYPRSAMDGYALHASDTKAASASQPRVLPVVGNVFAEKGEAELPPHTTMAITTGAPIPRGADAVIPFEYVERRDGAIAITDPTVAGNCIFPPGEDARCGELLLRSGELIRPATVGLLAFLGRAQVRVHRRPRVSLACTGNELVEVTAVPGHGQVRNSNAFALTALIAECGAKAKYCGTAPDDTELLRKMLLSAREGSDLVVTTGGASVGERDFVKSALEELGVRFRFKAVAMRPGKPMGFGFWDGVPVCVLPGNPAAVFVCFHELVQPALLRLAGRASASIPAVRATLRRRAKSKAARRYFMLARLGFTDDGFEVTPLANQCSALVRTSADANALIAFPEGEASFLDGDTVEVHVLDWGSVIGQPVGPRHWRAPKSQRQ